MSDEIDWQAIIDACCYAPPSIAGKAGIVISKARNHRALPHIEGLEEALGHDDWETPEGYKYFCKIRKAATEYLKRMEK